MTLDYLGHQYMTNLAREFPALREAQGVSPWNPNRLDIWAAEESFRPPAVNAARFLLGLWNQSNQWECGAFDVLEAVRCWDEAHRAAFVKWVRAPRHPHFSQRKAGYR